MIYVSIAGFLAFCGLLYVIRMDTLKRGKAEKENEIMEDSLDDIHLVKNARDRLRGVDASDSKLRRKYTRKP